MIYLKDLHTGNVEKFTSRYQIEKHLGMRTQIDKLCVERKRIIQGRYMVSDSLDFNKQRKKSSRDKTIFAYDLINSTITKEVDTLENIADKYSIDFVYFRNMLYNRVVNKNKIAFSYSDSEDFKLKKPKNIIDKTIKLPTFVVFNLKENTRTTYNDYLKNIADLYGISHAYFYEMLNKNIIFKKYLAVSRDEREFDTFKNELMKQKKFKKTNAQLKKQKVDLSENGDFVYKEPNKPAKRIGKLGVYGIKNRLKKR